jgi:uncharacterized glyoxalase superfamily metalloenzyme YdcJ
MPRRGIAAKAVIEGPPRRQHAILLRQTSFKALDEPIVFAEDGVDGSHTARFGEIEQRGMALTQAGRALYDRLLARVRSMADTGSAAGDYCERLARAFEDFPDDLETLLAQGLAFFRYRVADDAALARAAADGAAFDIGALHRQGIVAAQPIVYEDFLPVSAAGIFQSNLGGAEQKSYAANAAKEAFEAALGTPVADEIALYARSQQASIDAIEQCFKALQAS